jgi:branched-chain amino acid transport system permease protein
MGFLVIVVVLLAWALARTRIGIHVRAIADNREASDLVGVPMRRVSMAVYGLAGAIAALSGALVTPAFSGDILTVLFVFLRGLTVAVLGGFSSVTLALLGAVLFGMVDSMLRSSLFGDVSGGAREVVAVGLLFVLVLAVHRLRRQGKELLSVEGQ